MPLFKIGEIINMYIYALKYQHVPEAVGNNKSRMCRGCMPLNIMSITINMIPHDHARSSYFTTLLCPPPNRDRSNAKIARDKSKRVHTKYKQHS